MPNAVSFFQYPIPNTQYPVPNTQYPVPNTQYPIPNTQYPVPNTQYLIPPHYASTILSLEHFSNIRLALVGEFNQLFKFLARFPGIDCIGGHPNAVVDIIANAGSHKGG